MIVRADEPAPCRASSTAASEITLDLRPARGAIRLDVVAGQVTAVVVDAGDGRASSGSSRSTGVATAAMKVAVVVGVAVPHDAISAAARRAGRRAARAARRRGGPPVHAGTRPRRGLSRRTSSGTHGSCCAIRVPGLRRCDLPLGHPLRPLRRHHTARAGASCRRRSCTSTTAHLRRSSRSTIATHPCARSSSSITSSPWDADVDLQRVQPANADRLGRCASARSTGSRSRSTTPHVGVRRARRGDDGAPAVGRSAGAGQGRARAVRCSDVLPDVAARAHSGCASSSHTTFSSEDYRDALRGADPRRRTRCWRSRSSSSSRRPTRALDLLLPGHRRRRLDVVPRRALRSGHRGLRRRLPRHRHDGRQPAVHRVPPDPVVAPGGRTALAAAIERVVADLEVRDPSYHARCRGAGRLLLAASCVGDAAAGADRCCRTHVGVAALDLTTRCGRRRDHAAAAGMTTARPPGWLD